MNAWFKTLVLFLICCGACPDLPASRELRTYSCLARQFDTERWILASKHRFDPRGVLKMENDSLYHPLSVCFYGIFRYEDYMRTCDSTYRQAAIAQYQYFSSQTILHDGVGLGLPYQYRFKDMKPPWFSGMTQGVAISYLLRYFDLTGDSSALSVARQCAYFMLAPDSVGGCLVTTPEGLPWIEQYPSSKETEQVLNGFVNSLIGLKEYTDWFPADTFATRMHRSLYESFIYYLSTYDQPNWVQYNRSSRVSIRASYLRYQLTQMEHLLEIYPDDRIQDQMILWARFAMQNVDRTTISYLRPYFLYMNLFYQTTVGEGWQQYMDFNLCLAPLTLWEREPEAVAMSASRGSGRSPIAMTPVNLPIQRRVGEMMHLALRKPLHYIKLQFEGCKDSIPCCIDLRDVNGRKLADSRVQNGSTIELSSEQSFEKITISHVDQGDLPWQLTNAWCLDPHQYNHPRFLYLPLGPSRFLQKGKVYQVEQRSERIADLQVFYRYAPVDTAVQDSIWRPYHKVPLPRAEICPPADGFYEAFAVFPVLMPNPRLYWLRLRE